MGCSSTSFHLHPNQTYLHTFTHTHSRSVQFNQYKHLVSPRSLVSCTLGPGPSRCSIAATIYPRDASSPRTADCQHQSCPAATKSNTVLTFIDREQPILWLNKTTRHSVERGGTFNGASLRPGSVVPQVMTATMTFAACAISFDDQFAIFKRPFTV